MVFRREKFTEKCHSRISQISKSNRESTTDTNQNQSGDSAYLKGAQEAVVNWLALTGMWRGPKKILFIYQTVRDKYENPGWSRWTEAFLPAVLLPWTRKYFSAWVLYASTRLRICNSLRYRAPSVQTNSPDSQNTTERRPWQEKWSQIGHRHFEI